MKFLSRLNTVKETILRALTNVLAVNGAPSGRANIGAFGDYLLCSYTRQSWGKETEGM